MAIAGAPPFARGTDIPGRDLELQLASAFPRCPLFVEKPVSSGPEDACWRVAEVLGARGTLVGVGYMLRYLKGGYIWSDSGSRAEDAVIAVQLMK